MRQATICPNVQKLYYYASQTLVEAGHRPAVKFESQTHWNIKKHA